jgi:hypothetical protein
MRMHVKVITCLTISSESPHPSPPPWKIDPTPSTENSPSPAPTPHAKNKENPPPSLNPNRKNDKSGLIEGAHYPLNRSGLFSHQIVRLNKFDEAHPKQTRSKKEFGRNPLIVRKTGPNNTPQDPLGSQEGIRTNYRMIFSLKFFSDQ